jgi:hypothetical protein
MNSTYTKIAAFSLVSLLVLSPAVSFAKNKGEGKSEDKIERRDERENKEKHQCLRAFGHLISKGFIKNKGEVSFTEDCWMPFGIKKKYRGSATSTPDVIPPTVSEISLLTGTTTLSVSWKTNENAFGKLYFGTTTPLNLSASSTAFLSNATLTKTHLLTLNGLSASTTYYMVIEAQDQSGNKTLTPQFNASTK